jgi:hypothetical protein
MIEAKARLENITSVGFDIDEARIKLEKAKLDETNGDDFEKRLAKVAVLRHQFEISRKETILTQQQREVEFFLGVINDVAEQYGGADKLIEQMQDPEFHGKEESNFWTKKLARGVFSDLINYGAISKGVIEAIENLPAEQRTAVLQEANTRQVESEKEIRGIRNQILALKD